MKIPGYLFILVGVFVVVASLLIEDLKVFIVVGGLFIIYGLTRMGLNKLTEVLSPKVEETVSQRLDAKDNPYLKPQEKGFGGQQNQGLHQQNIHNQQYQQGGNQQQARHPQQQAQRQVHHTQQQRQAHHQQARGYAHCSSCGAKNVGHARFCNGCGSQLR